MANSKNASAANSAKNESASNAAQGLNNLAAQAAAFAAANISASNGSGGAMAKYSLSGYNAFFNESAKSIGKAQRLKIRRAKESAINKLIAAYAAQDAANIKAAKAQFLAFCGQIYFGIESASISQLNAGLLANANGKAQNKEAANLALQILQA